MPAMNRHPMKHTSSLLAATTAAFVIATQLAGCAVQPNGHGGVLVGLDSAELFGTPIGTFQLADGQQGVLRRDPGRNVFSVKLGGTMRVIVLDNAMSARIARVSAVGGRTVAVFETQERNCPYRYTVMSIRGTDVLQWSIGNCQDRPRAQLADNGAALHLDFPDGAQLQRYVYADGRLLQTRVPLPAGAAPLARPFADADLRPLGAPAPSAYPAPAGDPSRAVAGNRVIPAPPRKAEVADATVANTNTNPVNTDAAPAVAARGARRTTRAVPSAALPQRMDLPADEIKPVHIDLRKN